MTATAPAIILASRFQTRRRVEIACRFNNVGGSRNGRGGTKKVSIGQAQSRHRKIDESPHQGEHRRHPPPLNPYLHSAT